VTPLRNFGAKNLVFYCFDEINTSICLKKFFEEEFTAGKLLSKK
jgi:hypothetical protein